MFPKNESNFFPHLFNMNGTRSITCFPKPVHPLDKFRIFMFSQRQFFPVQKRDSLLNYSHCGNCAFDWDDLSNNSSHALLYMCRQNNIPVEEPYYKRTLILLLRDFIDSEQERKTTTLAPVREHVSDLKLEYISSTFKQPKRVEYVSNRSTSTSSISSETGSTSSTTSTTTTSTSNQPYLPEDQRKPEEKESLVNTVRMAFEKPRKFANTILSIPVEQQRSAFRYLMVILHLFLLFVYFTHNNFRIQKSPRVLSVI